MKTTIQCTLPFVKSRMRGYMGDDRFAVDNSYFTLASICFRQLIGIPLGFTNDLCTFHNGELGNNYNDIYPHNLKLKKKNEDPCKVSFLELSVEVHDRKYSTKLPDKRVVIPCYSNRMPYLDSNIPSKIFYAFGVSEFLCVAWTTTYLINMVTRVNLWLIRIH